MNEATKSFIMRHRRDDVRRLALNNDATADVDVTLALNQIQGWQTARTKLPSWAEKVDIVYPPHINMEQCSSESTARYKAMVIGRWLKKNTDNGKPTELYDLTGGYGIDFTFLSPMFRKAVYVERNESLCEIAKHNFNLIGLKNATIENGDSIETLNRMEKDDSIVRVIFLDPARRDAHGRKVVGIADCEPDVLGMEEALMAKADLAVLKLSPMLDWHEAASELRGHVGEVHIVAVKNECKELLLLLTPSRNESIRVVCHNDYQNFEYISQEGQSSLANEKPLSLADITGGYLYEPNAAVMKAGCFSELSNAFTNIKQISSNSHLFVYSGSDSDESEEYERRFPGRIFRITAVSSMNKKELKRSLAGVTKANVAVRNFPLSAEALRRKLKLHDGGDVYIFATTTADNKHILIMTKKGI